MFDCDFVQVFDVVRLRRDAGGSLRVFIEEFAFARLNCSVAPILQVVPLHQAG
jgi:hypothetical protein